MSDAEELAWYRECEWRRITRMLEALYVRQTTEGESILLRQHMGRLEALQQALMGFPESLAG
ncbi:hypothetical protein SAZ11_39090 [Streptomyces sp. FXJ1.4098]|uniref:hypothetical protein n=1 Tax=Streptomyces sp. NPDC020845 TaxID=3365096 RepID=UPI00299A64E1|nr:hypothetical protein [Streptomyces sp. FXJ1.4098]